MTEDRIARLDDDGLNTIFQQAFEDLLKMLHDADVTRRQQELEDKGHVAKSKGWRTETAPPSSITPFIRRSMTCG